MLYYTPLADMKEGLVHFDDITLSAKVNCGTSFGFDMFAVAIGDWQYSLRECNRLRLIA